MSGLDVCRVLKADPHFARTPVVLATDEEGTEVRRAAADGILPRAFDDSAFFDTLRRFLQLFPRSNERSPVPWRVAFWRDGAAARGRHPGPLARRFLHPDPRARFRSARASRCRSRFPASAPTATWSPRRSSSAWAAEPDPGLGCRFFRLTQASRTYLEDCLRLLSLAETPAD